MNGEGGERRLQHLSSENQHLRTSWILVQLQFQFPCPRTGRASQLLGPTARECRGLLVELWHFCWSQFRVFLCQLEPELLVQ